MSTSEHGSPPPSSYLFSGVEIRSPLEELEDLQRRRVRSLGSADDRAARERVERAYALAREALSASLAECGGDHRRKQRSV